MTTRFKIFGLVAALLLLCGVASSKSEPAPPPPVTVALIADVQYRSGIGTYRNYPAALANFRTILKELRGTSAVMTVELGDFIEDSNPAQEDLDYAMLDAEIRTLPMPIRHVPGNNDVSAMRRLQEKRGFGGDNLFYKFTIKELPGWMFVVLNTNEPISIGVGEVQLFWLDKLLTDYAKHNLKVMIFSHVPPHCLPDQPQVKALLAKHRKMVVGWIAGHTHAGEFHLVEGVPEVELSAVLENPDRPTYGFLKIYPDRWEIEGRGAQKSYRFPLE